uniref:Uncharacterized protein n=1 Tax=Meloidogyne javanica TaxID=6303 RepID=A0A915LFH4_MELJA
MEKHSKLKDLKLIFDLSSIQSNELDKAINEKFYEDHKKNKEMGRGYNYAVVEGAGPIGLYTTFKLFIEGINVTLINDRSEDYTREHFILLDRKWIYQLNLILGTQFDQLFNEENSMGRLLPNHVGIVIMKNFETALMNRLKGLALYVEEREENQQGENSFVKLIYETEVLSLNLGYEKPLAILGTPERLVLTESKNYSSIYIDKADPEMLITEGDYTYLSKSMIELGIHLQKQGFYAFIVSSNISHHLKTRYVNIINFIIYGVMEDGYGYLTTPHNNFNREMLDLHVFELKQRISIATNTPNALANFIEEIKAEMNENLHWEEYYVNFIKKLENKWAISLFKYLASFYRHDADKLIVETEENEGCDEEDDGNLYFKILSSNTFWIKIKGVENPAKRYRTENDSAIVAAVGDANTSAHFFTGSGLSTG